MGQIQSSNVPLQLSFDNGVTYKDLVCLENYNIDSTTNSTDTDTFCGTYVGTGVTKTTITGSAVTETAPLSTQVSAQNLKNAQAANTLLYVRANYPTAGSAGGQISNNASGYVTATGTQFAVNNLVKFSFTISINGNI